ncbi:MAG: leucine-rich repeat domain-containing protein, partial [Treponema sp.]|nr:leucine-rich repeat domain-containing protein [Treponema sp.]
KSAILLFLFPLFIGCYEMSSYEASYEVIYYGGNNTSGYPPVDSRTYFPGDTAIVLDKPRDLKKGNLAFLGWRQYGNDVPLQPGDEISIGHENIYLHAWWEDDPDNTPYEYALHPQTGGVIITKYYSFNNHYSTAIIPDEMEGGTVTAIGEGAFANANLDKVVLPGNLVFIGNKAFTGNWLRDIAVPDTVTFIGKLAFQNAYLESLSLGSGLETIDDYAFDGNSLTILSLPETVKSVGEGAFYGNNLGSIEIGADVAIQSETSLGTYGASFRTYYQDQGSPAGVYLYASGAWRGPYRR